MPFQIVRNDITKVKADAIVNTANPEPIYAAGTDSAIYHAAGEEKLLAERKKIGEIEPGNVAVTSAFALKAKYIIHTVGPAWIDGNHGEFDTLRSCYAKSLEKANELGCESIAFPLISTGVYGFPKDKALSIAMGEISSFLMKPDVDMDVKLVVFDNAAFRLSSNLFFQVESYIKDEEVKSQHIREYSINSEELEHYHRRIQRNRRPINSPYEMLEAGSCDGAIIGSVGGGTFKSSNPSPGKKKIFNEHTFDKELYMNDGKEELPFQKHFFDLILQKGLDNTTVYKSANVTRGAFSKIQNGDTKIPKKKTVLAFCIGMKLNMEEATELLASADMAFNPYDKRDQLVIQCIENEQYNIYEVNSMLYVCNLTQLS